MLLKLELHYARANTRNLFNWISWPVIITMPLWSSEINLLSESYVTWTSAMSYNLRIL